MYGYGYLNLIRMRDAVSSSRANDYMTRLGYDLLSSFLYTTETYNIIVIYALTIIR